VPRLITIIDTNLYRSTSDATIEDLRRLETLSGVEPMASFPAVTELLARAASSADSGHRTCRAALRRLWLHCAVYSVTDSAVNFAADPNGLLSKTLFDRAVATRHELADHMSSLVQRIALRSVDEPIDDIARQPALVRNFRDEVERRFSDMLAYLRRQFGLDKNADSDFDPSQRPDPREFVRSGRAAFAAAYGMVTNAASEVGIRLEESQLRTLAAILGPTIPTAIAIYTQVFEKVLFDGADPGKHANSIWDLHLGLYAAESMRVRGLPVIVVTEDLGIRSAAATTGARDRVLSLAAYRDLLRSRLAA
jgi:hypothetical protein